MMKALSMKQVPGEMLKQARLLLLAALSARQGLEHNGLEGGNGLYGAPVPHRSSCRHRSSTAPPSPRSSPRTPLRT